MLEYDPDHAPPPQEWLSLDEQERFRLAEDYHRRRGVVAPDMKAHAIFHAIVENQIAEQLDCVTRAMPRLMAEGLTRHEAVHAVGSVLTNYMHALLTKSEDGDTGSHGAYIAAVDELTAKAWRSGDL
jgi:hypothetical protein